MLDLKPSRATSRVREAATGAALLLALLVAGCGKSDPAGGAGGREFTVRGIIRGVSPDRSTVDIQHEAIPDFMPTMTMPFTLRDAKDASGFQVGDAVSFRLVVDDKEALIDNIRRIDAGQLDLPSPTPEPRPSGQTSARLRAGDMMPPFQLTDENGETIDANSFRGRPFILTFIFTRCPIPNFCPLMNRNFAEVQNAIRDASGPMGEARLLSISFDPEFDTPAVLKETAKHEHADPAIWSFATAPKPQIDQLTKSFAVAVQPEAGTISHSLATALVDANGRITEIWRGNGWKPGEVIEKLRETTQEQL